MTDQEASAVATTANQVRFSMRGLPLLTRGATMGSLGTAGNLWAHSKVYSAGGENALHFHEIEDHCFLVLQGKAIFEFGDGSSFTARPFEGVVLPKQTSYRFTAKPGENLVMIRVGGAQLTKPVELDPRYNMPIEISKGRLGPDGKYLDGDSKTNKTHSEPVEFAPGQFFSPD